MSHILEKEIEDKVCRYARNLGFLAYKFTSPGRISVPDRIMIPPQGNIFFIEFKMKGKKPTKLQEREHERLRERFVDVYVIDNIEEGYALIRSKM